jgi:hypothetical protein
MLSYACVYLAADKPAIVAAMHHNLAGIYYEQESPVVLADWRKPVELAAALRLALRQFSLRDRNLRETKKSDWPSYRVSGCRSVREFERTYLRIAIRALNDAELLHDCSAQPCSEKDITLHVTLAVSGADEEVGRLVLRLFDACSTWIAF